MRCPSVAIGDAECTAADSRRDCHSRNWLARFAALVCQQQQTAIKPGRSSREEAHLCSCRCHCLPWALPLRQAPQYPDRPIKMIVPWAAGGDTDNIFRPFAPAAAEAHRPDRRHRQRRRRVGHGRRARGQGLAGGRLHALCRARLHPPRPTTPASPTCNYTDFEPICLLAATPSVLTSSPKTPWKDWKEFVADAKKRARARSRVGATLGSTSHIFPAIDREGGRHQAQVRVL